MRSNQSRFASSLMIAASVFLLVTMSGCGGSSSPVTPMTPAGASNAGPPPSGGSTAGGTNGPSQDFYLASIFSVAQTATASTPQATSTQPRGTIKVNENASDGRGVLQIMGGDANSAYQLRFCLRGAPDDLTSCQAVADYSTDASGAATVSFQMGPGNYFGAFFVFKNNEVRFAGGHNETLSGTSFSSAMLPGGATPGRGRGEVTGETSRIAVSGGPPNESFQCMWLGLSAGASGQFILPTDAQGSGSTSLDLSPLDSPPSARTGSFHCMAKCQTGQCEFTYTSGFRVP
jgi:hypothetical protein